MVSPFLTSVFVASFPLATTIACSSFFPSSWVRMIPDFVIQNVDKTKQCIKKPPKDYVDTFQKLIQNEDVRFDIRVSGTEFTGVTAKTYSFKEFYDSAVKEGAFECGENQTNHF